MKKTALLNAELSQVIAGMGHTDTLVIGDAGLPVPKGVPVVDLALRQGVPGFIETLETVLAELEVEGGVVTNELRDTSPTMHKVLIDLWAKRAPLEHTSHDEFKAMSQNAKAVVRTGEFTPFSNIILTAGVVY
jgi:D-ribose pyranase